MRRIGQFATAAVAAAISAGILTGSLPGGASTTARAQGLEGPLAAPDATMPLPSVPKHPAAKRAKIKTVARRGEVPVSAKLPATAPVADMPPPVASTPSTVPASPVSFGMKWSGTNESGRETRFENLTGGAGGTGGEVGMKLHF